MQNVQILTNSEDKERELGVTEARFGFSSLVDQVQHQGDAYVIKRHGRRAAAIVPIKVYENWRQERQEFFDMVREMQKWANLKPKAAERLALEAVRWARSNPKD